MISMRLLGLFTDPGSCYCFFTLQTRRTGTQFIHSVVTCDVRHQFAVPILCVNELPFR